MLALLDNVFLVLSILNNSFASVLHWPFSKTSELWVAFLVSFSSKKTIFFALCIFNTYCLYLTIQYCSLSIYMGSVIISFLKTSKLWVRFLCVNCSEQNLNNILAILSKDDYFLCAVYQHPVYLRLSGTLFPCGFFVLRGDSRVWWFWQKRVT